MTTTMTTTTSEGTKPVSSDASLLASLTFSDCIPNLPDWLLHRCLSCGWRHPTVIQQRAWKAMMMCSDNVDGNSNSSSRDYCRDVVIQAQTGSGKTLAFLVPILASIEPSRAAIQAVIVVPTRELGLQVGRVAKRLTAKTPIVVMNILQGSTNKRQRAWAWSEPPQIVIGTPQELTDMVEFGGIRYNSVKHVVVDEVDACLLGNGGSLTTNAGPLHTLLSKYLSPTFHKGEEEPEINFNVAESNKPRPLSRQRQTVFCSATIPQHRHFLKQCVQNQWTISEPIYVCANPGDVLPPTLSHSYLVASSKEKKVTALRRLLTKRQSTIRKVIVFCEPNRPLEQMAQAIAKDLNGIVWKQGYGEIQEAAAGGGGIVSVLRYEDSVSMRTSAMLGFQGTDGGVIEGRCDDPSVGNNDGPIRILLSTDHAARGLDVEDVTHIIQFDLPHHADTYVHRAGRAGRLGRAGSVISILTPDQEFVLERMANKMGLPEIKCIGRQKL